jgi:hypothetical protein
VLPELSGREIFSRRRAARLLFSAAAAGLSLPPFNPNHAAWHSIFSNDPSAAEAELASSAWKPLFLNSAQEESLRAVAETILPGSGTALVSRFLDLLLSVDSEATKKKFVGSLEAIDQEASAKFGRPFSKASRQEQDSLLTVASTAPQGSPLRGHFDEMKEWIVSAYYSSEVGMRELGWTPDRVFPAYPSCAHSEEHS